MTTEEEVALQKSWHEDPPKCTFILLNRERLSKEGGSELSSMVGDTNLYLMEKMVQQKLRLW